MAAQPSGRRPRVTANDVVRARVNADVKKEAAAILAGIGLTPSDAYRMLLMRIVEDRALPFEPLVPNEATIAAMRESLQGGLAQYDDIDDLLSELNADD